MFEPIQKSITVACDQKTAFEVFADIGSWWPLDRRSMSGKHGSVAKQVTLDPKAGGEILELSEDGTQHLWGRIKEFVPFERFSMFFFMGLEPCESLVEVSFAQENETLTRVSLSHSNWEAYGDLAEMMFNGYGSSWGMLFEDVYKAQCEKVARV